MLQYFHRIIFLLIFMFGFSAHATFLDINALYYSEGIKVSSTTSDTALLLDGALGLSLTRRGSLVLGWSYAITQTTDSDDSESSLSVTEMGPKIGYYLNRDQTWALFATYNMIVKGTRTLESGTTQDWRGTSMKFELGYTAGISESMFLGLHLNYYLASYSEQIVDSSTYSAISNTQTIIYPTIHISFRF